MPLPVVQDALGKIEIYAITSDKTQAAIDNPKEEVQVVQVKNNEDSDPVSFQIPKEYRDFTILFEEEPDQEALP